MPKNEFLNECVFGDNKFARKCKFLGYKSILIEIWLFRLNLCPLPTIYSTFFDKSHFEKK
ncbi:MAG: hypothetical protein RLZZ292_975 [Bacteroidota bacterium]